MTETSTSMSIDQLSTQTELFRPSLHYPMHPYAEMLTRTAERYPEAELLAWANGKLATFKNVREIEFIDAIPRNPSGKILRRVLKQQRMGLS